MNWHDKLKDEIEYQNTIESLEQQIKQLKEELEISKLKSILSEVEK